MKLKSLQSLVRFPSCDKTTSFPSEIYLAVAAKDFTVTFIKQKI